MTWWHGPLPNLPRAYSRKRRPPRPPIYPPFVPTLKLHQTGWTRLEVAYADEHEQVADGSPTPKELVTRTPTPLLKVRTTHADIVTHLEGVVREVGAAQPPPPVDVQAMRARAAMSGAAV
jgi:hypothetical protein